MGAPPRTMIERHEVGRQVHEQPVVPLIAAGEQQVHEVESRQIDDAGVRARRRQRGLVLRDDVAPRQRDDELPPAALERLSVGPGDLRILDAEGHALAHLPPEHRLEIAAARRRLFESHQRHLGGGIGHDERDVARPPTASSARATAAATCAGIDDVRRGQRRARRACRQRLGGVRDDRRRRGRRQAAAPRRGVDAMSSATGGRGGVKSCDSRLIRRTSPC